MNLNEYLKNKEMGIGLNASGSRTATWSKAKVWTWTRRDMW